MFIKLTYLQLERERFEYRYVVMVKDWHSYRNDDPKLEDLKPNLYLLIMLRATIW